MRVLGSIVPPVAEKPSAAGSKACEGFAAPLDDGQLARTCFRNLLANPEERIFFKDLDSRFLAVSAGFLADQAHGRALGDVVGKTDFDFFSQDHAAAAFEDEQRIIHTGEPVLVKLERETFRDRPDAWVSTTKLPLRDGEGRIIGTWGISRDVTAQVKAERALARQTMHDPLTGLPNRLAFMDRLSQALASLERSRRRAALLSVDLDDFKGINASYGHDAGDRVLVEAARRLSGACRAGDTVACFGGDGFAVLCPGLAEDEDAGFLAVRALKSLGERFVDAGKDLTVSASIGAVVTADPAADPEELLRKAEVALYEAKAAGRDGFRVFDGELQSRRLANHDFDRALHKAVDDRELFVLYQPVFSLRDGSFRGAEALVRWRRQDGAVVQPSEFIALAEGRRLIGLVDDFVLDEACRQLAEWSAQGCCPGGFTVAVNISGRELSDPALVDRVAGAAARHGISPCRICVEVTETALVGGLGSAAATLASLSSIGARLALDDFGTGYSTLAHLQHLAVDVLKIDKSFVDQLGRSERDHRIIAATVAMAHALGMSVIAEGIETEAQLKLLSEAGCDLGQGFLVARPLPPGELFRPAERAGAMAGQ
jgi:diguanylate cyclase (GGDEF)-like protein/PAS domain S-box-containing protein